jgi:hypothetical protein
MHRRLLHGRCGPSRRQQADRNRDDDIVSVIACQAATTIHKQLVSTIVVWPFRLRFQSQVKVFRAKSKCSRCALSAAMPTIPSIPGSISGAGDGTNRQKHPDSLLDWLARYGEID